MSGLETIPPIAAMAIAVSVLLGAAMALIGSIGLLRLRTFYERIHPPTLGTTLGVAFILAASMLLHSLVESRPVLHEILIAVFAVVTTPVTYMLLLRAAVHREGVGRDASTSPTPSSSAASHAAPGDTSREGQGDAASTSAHRPRG